LKNVWVEPDTRDTIIDFISQWREKTGIIIKFFITWIGISFNRYNEWKKRYGRENYHNNWIPRDYWILDWEKEAIISYYLDHPLDGYRRVTYMMIDDNIVAVSPSTVYRILAAANLLGKRKNKKTKKGKGFNEPTRPHEHWHVDISYLNIGGTFYYLCSILDGYSRFLVHWEIRECMKEQDVEIIIQRARELFPGEKPRIISDNGPQFIARDFKDFIRISGMTHVRTSPYYPQSNGKIERWHQTLKKESIRPRCPVNLDDAKRIVSDFVTHYNNARLHSSLGYITPKDKMEGREKEIFRMREQRLEAAREQRKMNNAAKLDINVKGVWGLAPIIGSLK
jgi:putative transposase